VTVRVRALWSRVIIAAIREAYPEVFDAAEDKP
jgi:hypothetical protein